jgi:hypothetical protein
MPSIQIGDRVRVAENVASDYASCIGVVVATEHRQTGPNSILECVVEFEGSFRRSFLAFHLTRVLNAAEKRGGAWL